MVDLDQVHFMIVFSRKADDGSALYDVAMPVVDRPLEESTVIRRDRTMAQCLELIGNLDDPGFG
jgi:hypothetical protein